jgi:uncharacterized protein YigE (DUF2233 family)
VAPGVELRLLRAPNSSNSSSVVALRTTPEHLSIVSGTPREADDWRQVNKALAAVNGGFFDAQDKSLGLRASGGKKLSALHGKMWGVFYTRGSKNNLTARIVATNKFAWSSDIREAVQCGPRLVENGKTLKVKFQWARRTGIGIQRDGKVVVAVADSDVSLPEWAKLWAAPTGLNCRDALNLDGGPSSQLSLQTPSRRLHLRSGRAVPDAILIQ